MMTATDFYLDKVKSQKKKFEVFDILQHWNPTHYERLWLAGFLNYVGYSLTEVCEIIDDHSAWTDYNPEITAYQVATIFKAKPQKTHSTAKRRSRKWDLQPAEEYRIKFYRSIENHRRTVEILKANGKPVYCEGAFNPSRGVI